MGSIQIRPKMKYQQQLDLGFGGSIASIRGCEDLYRCIQCGTCSSTCPVSTYMEHTPRKIIAMTRAGFRDDVLTSNTIWLCSSCYSCTVECPKQIKITDVMYSLKRIAMQEQRHANMTTPVLAKEFIKSVSSTGRSNEAWIMTWTWLKTRPFELFRQAFLGMRMFFRGRLSFSRERMAGDRTVMSRLLAAAGSEGRGRN